MNNPLINRFGAKKMWVNWSIINRDGKNTKVPFYSKTQAASSIDPDTWKTYEEAETDLNNGSNGFSGLGIVFTPEKNLLGIDIDHCIGETTLSDEDKQKISQLVIKANTYTEISPSKTGLHLYLALSEPLNLISNRKGPFEAYTSSRYFTVTGQSYGMVKEVRTVTVSEAISLLSIIGYPWKKENNITQTPISTRTLLIDDSTLLNKMFNCKNGQSIKSLYNGDTSEYGDDESRADMALCSHLAFWTGNNAEQIERIWLSSPLGQREKTQNRKDYRDRTISNSIAGTKEIYKESISLGVTGFKTENPSQSSVINQEEIVGPQRLSELVIPKYENDWIWEGYLARRKITMFFATWKSGKSTFYNHLLRAIENKEDFLGCKTNFTETLVISEEDLTDWVQRRDMYRYGKSIMIDSQPFIGRPTPEIWKQYLIEKSEYCVNNKIDLVVVDTLANLWAVDDENSSSKVGEALLPFREFTKKGVAVLLIHHPKKSSNDIDNSTRGSSILPSFVDAYIMMKRIPQAKESQRELELRGRNIFNKEKVLIELIDNQKPTERYIRVGKVGEVRENNCKEIVMNVLKSCPYSLTSKEIRSESNLLIDEDARRISETQIWRVLRELNDQGLIEIEESTMTGQGKRAAKYKIKQNDFSI